MRKFRKFGAALTLAGVVATAMASSARLQASSAPGTGTANEVLCGLLQSAYDAAFAVNQSFANTIKGYATAVGCDTSSW